MLPMIVSRVVDRIFYLFVRERARVRLKQGSEVLMEGKVYRAPSNPSYPPLSNAGSRHIPTSLAGPQSPEV